jgi:spermidine/putrescine transport system substrate-binding protein
MGMGKTISMRKVIPVSRRYLIAIQCLLSVPFSMAETLTVYTWEAYIAEDVIDEWEQETNINIEQVFYDSDNERNAVLASGNVNNFDLVVFDVLSNQILGSSGHLVPVTAHNVPNKRHIEKRWENSCQGYSVPYFWGTVGLVYRLDKFEKPPNSWNDLLHPAPEHQGHIVMYQGAIETLIGPLILQGKKLGSEKIPALKEAHRLLAEQTPHVLSWEYILTYAKDPAQREQVHMALGFSGDHYTLMEMAPNEKWGFVVPKEGTGVWMDCIGVMQASNNKEAAFRFVNYLTSPRASARNAQKLSVATPNKAAYRLLDKSFVRDEGIFPSCDILDRSETYTMLSGDAQRLRKRIVSSVVRKYEAQ